MTTPEYLTEEQVAEMIQVHPGTLQNWRVRGEGPRFVKLGNRRRSLVRYRTQDIEEWMFNDARSVPKDSHA